MYWDDVGNHEGSTRLSALWLAHPRVRAAVNEAVTGDPNVWPLEWFSELFSERMPLERGAVIGCGTGNLERDLRRKQVCTHIDAIDVGEHVVRHAMETAQREALRGIDYHVGDGVEFLRSNPAQFDAVFFHGSLHHLRVTDALSSAGIALKENGILYLDEYVGPSMSEFGVRTLLLPNLVYYSCVPRALRRPRLVRTPTNPSDPTEMLESSRIMRETKRLFRVLQVRGYGGNLLGLIFPNLRHEGSVTTDATLSRLIAVERWLRRIRRSHYAVIIAQPR